MGNLILRSLCCLLFALLLVSSSDYCSETSQKTETIEISLQDWKTLQSNNNKLLNNLNQLEQELNLAREQLRISRMGLSEAQNELIESKQEIAQLKNELEKQKQQSQQLKMQLQSLESSSLEAENSLRKTNESLQLIISDVKAEFEERKRVERQLKNQRTLWQIVAIGAGIWAVSK